MTSVYISGPMTGLPDLNFPAFHAAAATLRARGLAVVNPAEVNPDATLSWEACMRTDIKALCDCDAIMLLPGWEASKGAHLELHLAHRLGMVVAIWPAAVGQLARMKLKENLEDAAAIIDGIAPHEQPVVQAGALAGALAPRELQDGWLCPKCGIDRCKAACPRGHHAALTGDCPMVGATATAPPTTQEPQS